MQQASQGFAFLFPGLGALSHTAGSSGREWKSPLLEGHQEWKLGHSLSVIPQATGCSGSVHISSFRERVLVFQSQASKAPGDGEEHRGSQGDCRWLSEPI